MSTAITASIPLRLLALRRAWGRAWRAEAERDAVEAAATEHNNSERAK